MDDRSGKAVGNNLCIGQRPVIAFGNSECGREMLHNDDRREMAYGPAAGEPDIKVATVSLSLFDEAKARGWQVVSAKNDWLGILPGGRPALSPLS